MHHLARITGFMACSTGLLFAISATAASHGAVTESASIDTNMMTRINAQIEADQYQIRVAGSNNGDDSNPLNFSAFNITQDYKVVFGPDHVTINPAQNDSVTSVTFKLNGWGYQNELMRAGPAEVIATGTRIEYRRAGITEWYNNSTQGLEQGFTLHRRPLDPGKGPIQVSIALDPSFDYRIEQQGQTLIASDANGKDMYRYDHLLAWDSNRKPLIANLQLSATRELVIAVDDEGAIYPITIDPLISNIDHVFRGPYSSRGNGYGGAVAIDGDTAVVGASRDEYLNQFHGTGAVYVYERNQGGANNWGLIKKIAPNLLRPGDRFGVSVALSGDLLVVGAPGVDGIEGTIPESGAVYHFRRNEGGTDNWGKFKKVESLIPEEQFGTAVAINLTGDTLAVSAPFNPFTIGTVHIYEEDEGGVANWGEVKQILLPPALYDNTSGKLPEFGASLSIDFDSLVVGVPFALHPSAGSATGVAVLYEQNEGGTDNWGEVITFVPEPNFTVNDTGFGEAVSILGDSIAVGFPGDDQLSPGFLENLGSVYLFDRDFNGAGTWGGGSARAVLTAPTPAVFDNFGSAVSIKPNSLLVGAPGAGNGSVFRHDRDQGGTDNWGLADTFTPSDGVDGTSFGSAIARQGGTILFGGPSADDSAGTNSGGVYVFDNLTGPVLERTKLSGNNLSESNTGFGQVVAIDNITVAIGARTDAGTGAVYVFYQDEGGLDNWGQVARLVGGDSENGDEFGFDLDLDGDLLVVGARLDLHSGFPDSTLGAVYIFERNFGGVVDSWGQAKELIYADNTTLGGMFGYSVGISNDTVVVSRPEDSSLASHHGSAYVYQQNFGGTDNWGEVKKLLSSDVSADDQFGESVTIDGDTIAIGAPNEDQLNNTGAVYVFDRNQGGTDNWGEVKRILPSNGALNDFFGFNIAIQGDELVVGAPGHNGGAAYIYQRDSGGTNTWGETTLLESPTQPFASLFGSAVDLDGDFAIVGEPGSFQGGGLYTVFSRDRDGIGAWGPLNTGSFLDMKTPPDASIGTDVAIHGRTILLGSSGGSIDSVDRYDTSGAALLRNLALPPQVVNINTDPDSGDGVLADGELLGIAITGMSVEFDQSMVTFSAQDSNNIRLVDHGPDELFDSATLCQSGMVPGGDDTQISESNIVYDPVTFITTFDLPGPLTSIAYTLILCPGLVSTVGFQLDGNGDSTEGDAFTISFGLLDTDDDGLSNVFENNNSLNPNDPDTDDDGIGDALDPGLTDLSNDCNGGDLDNGRIGGLITTALVCAGRLSVTVDSGTSVQAGGSLILMSPTVDFEIDIHMELLTVFSINPCPGCP